MDHLVSAVVTMETLLLHQVSASNRYPCARATGDGGPRVAGIVMASTTRIVKTACTGMNMAIIRYFGFGTGTAVGSAAARGPQSGNLFGSIIVVTGPAQGMIGTCKLPLNATVLPFHSM
jgi:hypothetical protein